MHVYKKETKSRYFSLCVMQLVDNLWQLVILIVTFLPAEQGD
jgi:hypothetical protein